MSLLLKGFAEKDRKVLLQMWKQSNVALWFSVASLVLAIAAILIAIPNQGESKRGEAPLKKIIPLS